MLGDKMNLGEKRSVRAWRLQGKPYCFPLHRNPQLFFVKGASQWSSGVVCKIFCLIDIVEIWNIFHEDGFSLECDRYSDTIRKDARLNNTVISFGRCQYGTTHTHTHTLGLRCIKYQWMHLSLPAALIMRVVWTFLRFGVRWMNFSVMLSRAREL